MTQPITRGDLPDGLAVWPQDELPEDLPPETPDGSLREVAAIRSRARTLRPPRRPKRRAPWPLWARVL